ncbi:MAG: thioredoxin family protein [Gemmatimonadaceae bacterium]
MTQTIHRSSPPVSSLITPARYGAADTFASYLAQVAKNREWWHAASRIATISEEHAERARAIATGGEWRLLALSEDWCGDAVNILPYVSRLADAVDGLHLRVLPRDANLDIMDAHLTAPRQSRSIPIVIALDSGHREHGWWGPRPAELQALAMGDWLPLPKGERRLRIRTWYARDRGHQTIGELIALLEGAEAAPGAAV